MFERFYAKNQTFRDNIHFLRQVNLKTLLQQVEGNLNTLEKEETQMADTIQDEDAALTAEETTVAAVVADVAAEITKFTAAAAAGVDTTPFVSRINAINAALQGVDASALAAVPAVPVTLPPATDAPATPG